MYCNLPSLYLKLHVVYEIIVPYMAPFLRATISSKKLSNKKKKVSILQCIWNGESISIWKKNLKLDTWRKIRQQLESNLESNWIFSQFWL